MKFATYTSAGQQRIGLWRDDGHVLDVRQQARELLGHELPGDMQSFIEAGRPALDIVSKVLAQAPQAAWNAKDQVRLNAPIPRPRKNIFCVGRNYVKHIEEGARARGRPVTFPEVPEFFSKPTSSVIGPDEEILWDPTATQQLDYEVELAIVVGTRGKNLTEANALDHVFGYTIVNDVSAREVQVAHGQWFKGKCMDTFCPVGPCIVTADEFGSPSGHRVTTRVNGDLRQDSNTDDLLFDCARILMWLSRGMTLEPGDIIATGTPAGVALGMTPPAWLRDGDLCELEIAGIGVLRNKVRKLD